MDYLAFDSLETFLTKKHELKRYSYFKLFKLHEGRYRTTLTKHSWLKIYQTQLVKRIMKSPFRLQILEALKSINHSLVKKLGE